MWIASPGDFDESQADSFTEVTHFDSANYKNAPPAPASPMPQIVEVEPPMPQILELEPGSIKKPESTEEVVRIEEPERPPPETSQHKVPQSENIPHHIPNISNRVLLGRPRIYDDSLGTTKNHRFMGKILTFTTVGVEESTSRILRAMMSPNVSDVRTTHIPTLPRSQL